MYLWRNLPEGQLVAVLRWLKTRRALPPAATAIKAEDGPRAGEAAAPAPR